MPESTRLKLVVTAYPAIITQMSSSMAIWFLDDEPTMRRVYESWISHSSSPLDPSSRVFPPSELPPLGMDDAMHGFAQDVLTANPRPRAVVIDENLRSQVERRKNATTGSKIAAELRTGGYTGTVIIRSANMSTKLRQQYISAGADDTMAKNETLDSLVRLLKNAQSNTEAEPEEEDELLVDRNDPMWRDFCDADRDAIFEEFRCCVRTTLDALLEQLDMDDVGALPSELHFLLGQCRAVGAVRMQREAEACKADFDHDALARLEAHLALTFAAMDERCGIVHATTAEQQAHAARMSKELARLSTPLIDWEIASTMSKLLPLFAASVRKELDDLRAALAAGELCDSWLHNLSGICKSIGAARLGCYVTECEQHAAAFGPTECDELEALLCVTLSAIEYPPPTLPIAQAHSHPNGHQNNHPHPNETTRAGQDGDGGRIGSREGSFTKKNDPPRLGLPPTAEMSSLSSSEAAQLVTTPLVCAGIDDSPIVRAMHTCLFEVMGADMELSSSIGETEEEQLHYLDYALGRCNSQLQPLAPPHRQVDVAVLDENITLFGVRHLLGSELVVQLRAAGFAGVVCILSGGSVTGAAEELLALPGVDVVCDKHFNVKVLAEELLGALAGRRVSSVSNG